MSTSLRLDQLLSSLVSVLLLLLQKHLSFSDLSLILLDGLLGFSICSISMFKSNIKLIEVSLQLLLVSESFILGSGFILKTGLHGLNGSLVSLSQAFKLLFLLLDSALNLLLHLA